MPDWATVLRPVSRRIIDALANGPASLTDLARATRRSKPALVPYLKDLVALGLIEKTGIPTPQGREVRYRLQGGSLALYVAPSSETQGPRILSWAVLGFVDPEFPLSAHVPASEDRAEVVVVLREIKRKLPQAWDQMFIVLFGSLPRGASTWKSDIDLMFVLPDDAQAMRGPLADVIADTQMLVRHAIQPFMTTRSSFLEGKKRMESIAADDGVVLQAPPQEGELWTRIKRHKSISI